MSEKQEVVVDKASSAKAEVDELVKKGLVALDQFMENCIAAIKDVLSGKVHKTFIEMSSCAGSCINGPALSAEPHLIESNLRIREEAGREDFPVKSYSHESKENTITGALKTIMALPKKED